MQNVLFLLYHHLSHEANQMLVPKLMVAAAAIGAHALLMLRLLCQQLFPAQLYKAGRLLARGAYAQVKKPIVLPMHPTLLVGILAPLLNACTAPL